MCWWIAVWIGRVSQLYFGAMLVKICDIEFRTAVTWIRLNKDLISDFIISRVKLHWFLFYLLCESKIRKHYFRCD